jgi:hypothetical protein
MMHCRRTVLLLAQIWVLAGCATTPPLPPVPVEIQVPVAVPCQIDVPSCPAPAYDAATKDQAMDLRLKLLRVEAIEQADCLARTRGALEACRAGAGAPAR